MCYHSEHFVLFAVFMMFNEIYKVVNECNDFDDLKRKLDKIVGKEVNTVTDFVEALQDKYFRAPSLDA